MRIAFSQVYIALGANFPFSVHFQRRLTKEATGLVEPSLKFIEAFGDDFELGINVSAKHNLTDNEVAGPTVFKKSKAVEYTVFLPFDAIMAHTDAPRYALMFLLKGVCDIFDMLEIDKTKLLDKEQSLIDTICSDPTMLEKPSWNDADNNTLVRKAFTEFFEKTGGSLGGTPPKIKL